MSGDVGLVPTKVRIKGQLKVWGGGAGQGVSDGSSFSVEYDVPDGIDLKTFRRLCLEQKQVLDQMALITERLKDAIGDEFYKLRMGKMKQNYDRVLGRLKDDGAGNTTEGSNDNRDAPDGP